MHSIICNAITEAHYFDPSKHLNIMKFRYQTTLTECPALQGPKKSFFPEFFLKGKEKTEICKFLVIFKHIFEE